MTRWNDPTSNKIPAFDRNGNLPPGIHRATMEEVVRRFGSGSEEREIEARELLTYVAWARNACVRRLLVNGSFVTSKRAPNDVDLIVLPSEATLQDPGFTIHSEVAWPFLQILVAADDADFERWATGDFATNRRGQPKGVVEVVL